VPGRREFSLDANRIVFHALLPELALLCVRSGLYCLRQFHGDNVGFVRLRGIGPGHLQEEKNNGQHQNDITPGGKAMFVSMIVYRFQIMLMMMMFVARTMSVIVSMFVLMVVGVTASMHMVVGRPQLA